MCAEMSASRANECFRLSMSCQFGTGMPYVGTLHVYAHIKIHAYVYSYKVNSISVQPDVVACDWHD